MSDTKPSNPKDLVGSKKLDLGNVPDSAMIALAQAFFEGAVKYGRYNWRIAGVSASTYHAALKRHVSKWWNGQNKDPETRVHHLANAMACLAILFDAELYNMLTDDRPPCPDPDAMARAIDDAAATVEHLRKLFAAHNPKQYTIADTRKECGSDCHFHPTVRELASPPLPENVKHCGHEGCTRPVVSPAPYCYAHADVDRRPPEIGTTSGRCLKANCYNDAKDGPYCPTHRPVDL
jgi:hypothetical protein